MSLNATPIGLSVISTLNGTCLRVSWAPTVDPTNIAVIGYNVYRSEIVYGDFSKLVGYSSLPGTTYFDTPPTPNDNFDNLWYYRVSSVDSNAVESLLSGPATYLNYAAFDEKPVPGLSWGNLF